MTITLMIAKHKGQIQTLPSNTNPSVCLLRDLFINLFHGGIKYMDGHEIKEIYIPCQCIHIPVVNRETNSRQIRYRK